MRVRASLLVVWACVGGLAPVGLAADVPTRHVENPGFETSLRAWRLRSSATTTAASWVATEGLPSSPGSAWVTATTTGAGSVEGRLFQCIPHALPNTPYTLTASWYAPGGQPLDPGAGGVWIRIREFEDQACTITSLEEAFSSPDATFGGPGNGGWQAFTRTRTSFTLTHAIGVELRHSRTAGQPMGTSGVYFDGIAVEGSFGFVKGDLDGGAETDLLLRQVSTDKHLVWFLNDESLALEGSISPPAPGWQAVGVDDWDGDGRNDLLMWDPVNGWLDFWFMNGTARVGPAQPISIDPGPAWKPSATADFDGDSNPDIVLRNPTTQAIEVWNMDGATRLGVSVPTPDHAVNANWEIVGAGDLNGDGALDLLWYNWSSGRIVYWLLNANLVRTIGAFTNPMAAVDANWKVLAMGDYGHGPAPDTGFALPNTLDLVWRNANSGRMVIWFMDRSGNRTSGRFVDAATPPEPAADWTIAGPR